MYTNEDKPHNFEEYKIEKIETSFKDLVEVGIEKWVQNYTISHEDKLKQLDVMLDYFKGPNVEEYEKCQYILDLKNGINTYRYML
jgi:hypothetical protein|tara:strand:- start:223 stop:477 length:255 start_codon:yes stop_codon:yes gene_type:complete